MRVDADMDSQMKSGGSGRPHISRKSMVEIVAVLGVYILFLIIAVYSGQTTMNIDVISPPAGTRFQSSPVELTARVTIKNVPVPDVEMLFTIHYDEKGEGSVRTLTDGSGIARLVLPLQSGNCTWHVSATKEGYPTILSRSNSFSIRLALIVYGLSPLPTLALSPVSFAARVTDTKDQLVTSANVTFYVDSTAIGSSLTATNGIAKLSSTVDPGQHTWFASANAGSEGGVSDPTSFIVAQASSLVRSDPVFFRTNHCQPTFDSRTPNSAYFSFTNSDCANTASESLRVSCVWFLLSTPALSNARSVRANRTPFQILSLCSGHTPHRSITRKL